LVCMMHRHGYGAAERIRMEIRRAWQFRFDWYFKSRSAQEIQKRCDAVVKIVERENEELRKKELVTKANAPESTVVPEQPQPQEAQPQSPPAVAVAINSPPAVAVAMDTTG
jgi:SWI/SNF-related matrix-associated actin-dependent regulator of chromatin subfamily A member 5